MEECIKWDDSRYEIMDIIEMIENSKAPQIPIKCPICNTNFTSHFFRTKSKYGR